MTMYRLFHDLALDLRSTTADLKRAKSFRSRVLHFLYPAQNVELHDCIHKVTYVHLLSDHIPRWMVLWCELLDFGYGLFTGSSDEHLNKVVKMLEMTHSNLSSNRYNQILLFQRCYWTTQPAIKPAPDATRKDITKKGNHALFIPRTHHRYSATQIQIKFHKKNWILFAHTNLHSDLWTFSVSMIDLDNPVI